MELQTPGQETTFPLGTDITLVEGILCSTPKYLAHTKTLWNEGSGTPSPVIERRFKEHANGNFTVSLTFESSDEKVENHPQYATEITANQFYASAVAGDVVEFFDGIGGEPAATPYYIRNRTFTDLAGGKFEVIHFLRRLAARDEIELRNDSHAKNKVNVITQDEFLLTASSADDTYYINRDVDPRTRFEKTLTRIDDRTHQIEIKTELPTYSAFFSNDQIFKSANVGMSYKINPQERFSRWRFRNKTLTYTSTVNGVRHYKTELTVFEI